MASVTKTNGRTTIQFISPTDRKRRSIRLGKIAPSKATEIKGHVEHLVECWRTGNPVSAQTDRFVAGLLADPAQMWLYDRLAAVKLVPERERPEDQAGELSKLGTFLDAYISGRSDTKPRTRNNMIQAKNWLVEFFGAQRCLDDITPGDADDFQRWLFTKLGENTARRHCGRAKQFFRAAYRKRLIAESPFADMKNTTVRPNRERDFFITRDMADKVLDACPDLEWRLLFSLSRYGGLRCPSEHLALTWDSIDWAADRIIIRSPKTEHHEGKESRVIPLFPELKPLLEQAFDQAPDGAVHVIHRYRDTEANLRTHMLRIIRRAGLEPWPKVFQNLRATRETELTTEYPMHVVCAWIGNSPEVARKHYLQITEADFDRAVQNAVQTVHITSQSGAVTRDQAVHENTENTAFYRVSGRPKVPSSGFEPPTYGLGNRCSIP
jgi:integrase